MNKYKVISPIRTGGKLHNVGSVVEISSEIAQSVAGCLEHVASEPSIKGGSGKDKAPAGDQKPTGDQKPADQTGDQQPADTNPKS